MSAKRLSTAQRLAVSYVAPAQAMHVDPESRQGLVRPDLVLLRSAFRLPCGGCLGWQGST